MEEPDLKRQKQFDSVESQIAGLGEIDAIQQIYVAHTKAAN